MTHKQRKQQPKGRYARIWLTGATWARIQPMVKERGDLSGIIIEAIDKQLPEIEKTFNANNKPKAKRLPPSRDGKRLAKTDIGARTK